MADASRDGLRPRTHFDPASPRFRPPSCEALEALAPVHVGGTDAPTWAQRIARREGARSKEKALNDVEVWVGSIIANSESPLEEMFAGAMVELYSTQLTGSRFFVFFHHDRQTVESLSAMAKGSLIHGRTPLAFCAQQVPIGHYRADFVIVVAEKVFGEVVAKVTAVECDGHDYHDRTKEQAIRDRARDREFLRYGVATIRFTGKEIYADPMRCAVEALVTAGVDDIDFSGEDDVDGE